MTVLHRLNADLVQSCTVRPRPVFGEQPSTPLDNHGQGSVPHL